MFLEKKNIRNFGRRALKIDISCSQKWRAGILNTNYVSKKTQKRGKRSKGGIFDDSWCSQPKFSPKLWDKCAGIFNFPKPDDYKEQLLVIHDFHSQSIPKL